MCFSTWIGTETIFFLLLLNAVVANGYWLDSPISITYLLLIYWLLNRSAARSEFATINYLQTLGVSLVGERLLFEQELQTHLSSFGRGDNSGFGDIAQVVGGRHIANCPRVWLGHCLQSQKQEDMNQVTVLDYGSQTLICSSFSFFENGPDLELEKGIWRGFELYLLNYVFL